MSGGSIPTPVVGQITQLTKGTSRVILSTKDPAMAQAVNLAVEAIRELQVVVQALQERVAKLEKARG